MAWFCRAWRLTPDQYRALTHGELDAMTEVLREETRKRKAASEQARSSASRRGRR